MRFVLYALAGVVLGGSFGYVGSLTVVAFIFSGQQPVSFFWMGVFGALLGFFGGLVYAGIRRGGR